MAYATAELTWLASLLCDLGVSLLKAPTLVCENLSALHLTCNPMLHARNKDIEVDYHYVREQVTLGLLQTQHVPSSSQVVDIFTKPLTCFTHAQLHPKLNLIPQLSLQRIENNSQPQANY